MPEDYNKIKFDHIIFILGDLQNFNVLYSMNTWALDRVQDPQMRKIEARLVAI